MAETHFPNEEIEREESTSKDDKYPHDVLVSDIRTTLKSLGPPLSGKCCIYRVPTKLRTMNEAAYTPQAVSIGPFHYGKTSNNMQKLKLRYLDKFLERAEKSASLEDFVSTIKEWESRIRCCYVETFDNDEFVKMILMDAAFISELFLRNYFSSLKDENDSILLKPWLRIDIKQDLILLENQLPFFILELLYNLAFASMPNIFPSFFKLTCFYFCNYNIQNIKDIQQEVKHFTDLLRSFQLPTPKTDGDTQNDKSNQQKVKPFTDLLRCFQLPGPEKNPCGYYLPSQLYSATELHEAGVKFKESSSNCLLDIKFSNGVLTIPCLELFDSTESFIRNLMALEQCHYPGKTYVCDYVLVMDYLINTAKDVDLLVQKKIIFNCLGDRGPVATLFNKLCIHVTFNSLYNYYTPLCKELNEYHKVRRHRWKAILRHQYFNTPWRIASIIVAFILLALTLTQTICAIISL